MKYCEPQLREEWANAITHGIGVILIIIASPFLLLKANSAGVFAMQIAAAVFSFSLLTCYLSSTLYHAFQRPSLKKACRIADHISIFLLIGGTYTPVVLKFTPDTIAFPFLAVMWSLIAMGSVLKLFFTGRYEWLSMVFYLFLGWMLLFIIEPVSKTMPDDIFWWIIGGGLMYTTGVIFYITRTIPFGHSIWHCFVLAGTIIHFTAIYQSIDVAVRF